MDANKAISETKQLLHILRKLDTSEIFTIIDTIAPNKPREQIYEEDHEEWITIDLRDGSRMTFVLNTKTNRLDRIYTSGLCDGCKIDIRYDPPDISIKWPESWSKWIRED